MHAVDKTLIRKQGIIGDKSFNQSIGVRQGSCLSWPLFNLHIDETVRAADDWIGDLRTILLMDDMAVIATSRDAMSCRLDLLKKASDNLGMKIHPSKSKYLTVGVEDEEPLRIDEVTITQCRHYVYLGRCIFNGPIAEQVKMQIKGKKSYILKFVSTAMVNSLDH